MEDITKNTILAFGVGSAATAAILTGMYFLNKETGNVPGFGALSCPTGLTHATLDECAECLPVSRETSSALWALMPRDEDIPARGEWPEPDSADRKATSVKKFWNQLTGEQQEDSLRAAKKEGWI